MGAAGLAVVHSSSGVAIGLDFGGCGAMRDLFVRVAASSGDDADLHAAACQPPQQPGKKKGGWCDKKKRKPRACVKCREGGRGEELAQSCPGRASMGQCRVYPAP